jgi:hypothetical protein
VTSYFGLHWKVSCEKNIQDYYQIRPEKKFVHCKIQEMQGSKYISKSKFSRNQYSFTKNGQCGKINFKENVEVRYSY